ncbi:MAG: hypothetical protein QOF40_2893, partial [Actinomycetota bacterium]|nr:hypothetical protein [Actinomycetota bacterium]
MPLSEHEQRLLDQIERALYQEDPKFASTVRSTDLRTHMKRRLRRAAFVLVLGVVMLLGGLVSNHIAVGIAGFVVMVGALALALSAWKRLGSGSKPGLRAVGSEGRPSRDRRSSRTTPAAGSSLLSRLEERWKRRWDERGQ